MNQTLLEKDARKAAKGAGISILGLIGGRGLWFLSQIIVARFFGPAAFGLYILGVTCLKIAELFARFGLHGGVMRFISIYRKDNPSKIKGIILSSLGFVFINGLVFGALLYVLSHFLAVRIFEKPQLTHVIQAFALCVPFMASMMVVAAASKGFHTTKYDVYIRCIIQPTANIILILLFILCGFSLTSVIYAFLISHAIGLIAGIFFLSKQFPGLIQKTLAPSFINMELIKYSMPLVVVGFWGLLLTWTDTIILGILRSSHDVGVYKAAAQMPLLLYLILDASNSIYAPIIAEMHHAGDKARMGFLFRLTTKWVYSLVLPVSLVLIFSAPAIMSIFGRDFVETGSSVLIVLTISQFVNCATGGVGYTLAMTGRQNLELINSTGMVLINFIMCMVLIPRYGSLGAAIATATSMVSINIIRLFEIYLLFRIHPYSRSYAKPMVPAICAVALILVIMPLLPVLYTRLAINTLIVLITFTAAYIIFGFDEEERVIIVMLKQKFSKLKG